MNINTSLIHSIRPKKTSPFSSSFSSALSSSPGSDVFEPSSALSSEPQNIHPAFQPPVILPGKIVGEEGAIIIIGKPKARIVIEPSSNRNPFIMSDSYKGLHQDLIA